MSLLRTTATLALLGGLIWMVEPASLMNSVLDAKLGLLALAALLLPLNLWLEVVKWRRLLAIDKPTPVGPALGSILAGYALGFFTPARSGEYLGRALYLPGHRIQTAVKTGVDRLLSMWIYLFAGLIAGGFALASGFLEASRSWVMVLVLGLIVAAVLLVLLLRADIMLRVLGRLSSSNRWREGVDFLKRLDSAETVRLFGLSAARYVVFLTQFVVLVLAFGGGAAMPALYGAAILVFFVKTLVPQFTLADLGVRESAAVFLFGLAGVESATALNASVTLFAINLLLPALAGAALVPRIRLATPFNLVSRIRTRWSLRSR